MEQFNPSNDVTPHLAGIAFPIGKRDLANRVKLHGAPQQVVEAIERLPREQFESRDDLTRAMAGARRGR